MISLEDLKKQRIWLCWRFETVNGRLTKKPVSACGIKIGTSNNYSSYWVTYNEALKAKESAGYDGVGFIIPKGYFFLDIDHKEISHPLVQLMMSRFESYAEHSQSGNGIHIYGKCDFNRMPIINGEFDKRYYIKNPKNDMELYIGGLKGRFAVYTGNAIKDIPLSDCTDAVLITYAQQMSRERPVKQNPVSVVYENENDELDIICSLRRAKNGEKFSRLFDEGDISGFGSHSEADCSLCAIIAFRTGNDPHLIDSIFRKSALYREKWERKDYREATIAAGVAACNGVFHNSVTPRPDYIEVNAKTGAARVNCPMLAKHIRENLRYIFVRDNGRSGVLKYVYENGCYRLYADEMLKGVIKKYITDYDENILKMSAVDEVFKQLTTDLNFVSHDELNGDEDIINFQNGILRLSDMTLAPHSPDILSTIQLPCDWNETSASTPVFDKFILALTGGDKAVGNFLLEFMGVCLSNVKGWRMKKALFLYGKGDTGKSQLKSLTEKLLGRGNYVGIDLKEIEARFGTGNIYDKRLAGSSDMSFMSVDELKTFKKCTGGDSLFAEFKGKDGFEFTYNGLLWFCMNRLPKFSGDDGKWVYERIMPIECKNVIPPEKQDKTLLDKMYAEREGIVYKCVMALKKVINNGYNFAEPQSVIDARNRYMVENNTVIAFFNECMTRRLKISDQCTVSKIYSVYRAWCCDNNHGFAKTAKEFRNTIAEHLGATYSEMSVRRSYGMAYRDYTLTDEAKTVYCKAYGYDETMFLAADNTTV